MNISDQQLINGGFSIKSGGNQMKNGGNWISVIGHPFFYATESVILREPFTTGNPLLCDLLDALY